MVPRWRACRGVVGVVALQRPHGGVVAVSVTVRESHEVVVGATSARWQGGRLAEVVPRRCRVGGCGSGGGGCRRRLRERALDGAMRAAAAMSSRGVTGGGRRDRRGADDAMLRCGYRVVVSYDADGRREIPAADTTVADVPSDRQ